MFSMMVMPRDEVGRTALFLSLLGVSLLSAMFLLYPLILK